MPFSENISNRVREALVNKHDVEEKQMFGGICFMVNGKMCMGVVKDELMCRIDPAMEETVLEMNGCRPMDFNGKPMKGYVFVNEDEIRNRQELDYWVQLCLAYNPLAKASAKKKSKK